MARKQGLISKWMEELESDDSYTRYCAVVGLAACALSDDLNDLVTPAIPKLIRILSEEKDPSLREKAIEALAVLSCYSELILPALRGALKDPDTSVSDAAREALNELGEDLNEY